MRRGKRSLRHCPSKITSNTFNSVLTQSVKQPPLDKPVVDNRRGSSPARMIATANAAGNAAVNATVNGSVGRENRSPDRQADGKRLEWADARQSDRQPDRQSDRQSDRQLDKSAKQPDRQPLDGQRPVDSNQIQPIDSQSATRDPRGMDKQQIIKNGSISIHLDRSSPNDRSDQATSQLNSKLQNGQTQ